MADEIHCDLLLDGRQHAPIASLAPEIEQRAITLMAPSKTFNLPGLKCAVAIIPNAALRERFVAAAGDLVPKINVLGCTAAVAAYREGDAWLEALLGYLKANRDFLVQQVRATLPGVTRGAGRGDLPGVARLSGLGPGRPRSVHVLPRARPGRAQRRGGLRPRRRRLRANELRLPAHPAGRGTGADARRAGVTQRIMALRRHLVILAALTILPLLVFTTWTVLEMHREERARAERALTDTARALSLAVDGEVAAIVAALESLATSRDLDSGNLRAFHAQASALKARQAGWTAIALTEAGGADVLNVLRPLGAPLPPLGGDPADLRQVVTTGRPVVSDAFVGPLSGQWVIAVRVPVVKDGRVRYVLTTMVHTRELRDVLLGQRLPSAWIGTILDRKRVIIARTQGEEQFVGQPASEPPAGGERAGERGLVPRPHQGGHARRTPPSADRRAPASRWRSACRPR